jgi:hypothetical protein
MRLCTTKRILLEPNVLSTKPAELKSVISTDQNSCIVKWTLIHTDNRLQCLSEKCSDTLSAVSKSQLVTVEDEAKSSTLSCISHV